MSLYIIAIKGQIVQKIKKFYNFTISPKAIKFCYNKAKYSMMIKCLLKGTATPPEGMDDAVQTVMTSVNCGQIITIWNQPKSGRRTELRQPLFS